MSQNEQTQTWCDALRLVPARWRAAFCQFIDEGEASEDFLAYLAADENCRQACEIVLRADKEMTAVFAAIAEPNHDTAPLDLAGAVNEPSLDCDGHFLGAWVK